VPFEALGAADISASLAVRLSVLIRASSRRAAVRLAMGAAKASSTGNLLAVYLLAVPARCWARRRGTSVLQPVYSDPSAQRSM
jgi:hypothetical protein